MFELQVGRACSYWLQRVDANLWCLKCTDCTLVFPKHFQLLNDLLRLRKSKNMRREIMQRSHERQDSVSERQISVK